MVGSGGKNVPQRIQEFSLGAVHKGRPHKIQNCEKLTLLSALAQPLLIARAGTP